MKREENRVSLTIDAYPAGPLETNAYLVADDQVNEAIIIDAPYGVTATLLDALRERGLTPTMIVITHAHWDHIADAAKLKEELNVPLAAPKLAVERLAKPGSAVMDLPFTIPPVTPDQLLEEGDEVSLGTHRFQVLHLPGHDPAHIVLYSEQDRVLLGGDVLFPGGHGTTEVPGADQAEMNQSLKRIARLPGDVVVYPGHGQTTRLSDETWLQEVE